MSHLCRNQVVGFVSKNQQPGFYISGTLVENGLILEVKFGDDVSLNK